MMGPAKHIDRLDFFRGISPVVEVGQIPGQSRRITRDVDDSFWFRPGNGIEDRFATTSTGRVKDNDIRMDAVTDEFRQFIDSVTKNELGILDMIILSVLHSVFNSRCYDFDTIDLLCLLGKEEGYRARTAIDVSYDFIPFKIGKLQGHIVKFLRLFAIDLEERLS